MTDAINQTVFQEVYLHVVSSSTNKYYIHVYRSYILGILIILVQRNNDTTILIGNKSAQRHLPFTQSFQ